MKCPADGALRSRMDGELDTAEANRVDAHLRSCPKCEVRANRIRGEATEVQGLLAALQRCEDLVPDDTAKAYASFRGQFGSPPDPSRRAQRASFALWKKTLGGALAAGIAIALLVGFAPARSWGQRILEMLRVQKIAVVPIDLSAMETNARGDQPAGKLLSQMISDSVVVTMKPGEPQIVTDPGAASNMAGFTVRTLGGLGLPQKISIRGEAAFHTTLDRERMQDLLDQAGRSDIQIPPSANGSTIAVHIGKLVWQGYGNCTTSRTRSHSEARRPTDGGATGSGNCVSFLQVPSPVVSVPPTLDVPALAEAGLEVTGMNAADAHAFCQTVDWSSTLVIPVPQRGSSFRTVAVDGVNGELVETAARGKVPAEYALLWVKNGIVYSLNGSGDSSQALAAAASLN